VYFRITSDSTELVDPQDVTSFSVVCPDGLGHDDLTERVRSADLGELLPDGDHLMVSVDAIRRHARENVGPAWAQDLAGMIGYATRKGWVSEDGSRVRAHIERGTS
jgi:hypothetical protein